MGWVSQSSYIFGWGNGGNPGPGQTPSLPFVSDRKEEDDEE